MTAPGIDRPAGIRGWHAAGRLTGLLVLLLLAFSVAAQQAKKSDKLKQSRTRLEQEIKATTELLENTRKSKQTSLGRVKVLSRQIRSREKLITSISQEINGMEIQLTAEQLQIARLTRNLEQLRADYARMICHAYRTMNGHSKLAYIFSASDFNQAWQRLRYYRQYSAYRREQAVRMEAVRRSIDAHVRDLATVKNEKMSLVQSQIWEKQKLDREKKEKDKAVKELSTKEKQLLATVKEKQKAAKQLNSEIEKSINAEIRAAEERTRKKESSPGKGKSPDLPPKSGKSPETSTRTGKSSDLPVLALTPSELQLSSSFAANRGKLPWPCDRGVISGDFGEHAHPVLKNIMVKNNGIDIMTEKGAPVRAVFGGKVSRVMSFQHLNRVIIIRHGEYLTVYSNLGEVNVREGEVLKTGQVIGKMVMESDDPRVELHFELWRGKQFLDPENWLMNR